MERKAKVNEKAHEHLTGMSREQRTLTNLATGAAEDKAREANKRQNHEGFGRKS